MATGLTDLGPIEYARHGVTVATKQLNHARTKIHEALLWVTEGLRREDLRSLSDAIRLSMDRMIEAVEAGPEEVTDDEAA